MSYSVQPILRECFENETTDADIIEKVQHDIPENVAAVTKFTKYIALIIAILATVITITFITLVIKAIKAHKVSRKCYVLILNRSFGDLSTSFSFVIMTIFRLMFQQFNQTQLTIFQILQFVINAALWSEMISYNLLSGIKLYAVAKPLHYRNKFTMKRCIYLASLSWIVFFVMFALHLGMYIVCGKGTCGPLAGKIEDTTSTGIYCFTVIFFILTAISVYRARKFQDDRSRKSKFPFSTFAVMFGVFIFFYSFMIAADIYFSFIYPSLSFCYKTLKQASVAGVQESVWILLLIRIVIDPIINCFIDKRLNASVKSMFGRNPSVTPAPVNKQRNARITDNNNNNTSNSSDPRAPSTNASNATSPSSSTNKKPAVTP